MKLEGIHSGRSFGNQAKARSSVKSSDSSAEVESKAKKKLDARIDKVETRIEHSQQRYEKLLAKRRGYEKQDPPATTPTSSPPSTPAVPPKEVAPTAPTTGQAPTVQTFAEKYVEFYEKNSGITLSQEERKSKIQDVANFYSNTGRSGRLESLVTQLA